MEKGRERHLFPGNNTPAGFYSYYQYILPQTEANHIFCLKGGPGVGKSTFMKRIGAWSQQRGYAVEYLHCSSDPGSLDGIVIPGLRIALIDGTAPHVVDPKNPGAVDEILNLGEYWDVGGIKKNKDNVIKTNSEVGELFKRAYRFIAAAKSITDDITSVFEKAANLPGIIAETESIKNEIFAEKSAARLGNVRKLFASAFTPAGIVDYSDTLFDDSYYVYIIKNRFNTGVNSLLERISGEAMIRGFDAELYYCPMEPEKRIDHCLIPKLKVAFLSESENQKPIKHSGCIDLTVYINDVIVEKYAEELNTDTKLYHELLGEATLALSKAKSLHDDMEQYYIPYMDFDSEKKKCEEIFKRILEFVE